MRLVLQNPQSAQVLNQLNEFKTLNDNVGKKMSAATLPEYSTDIILLGETRIFL